MSKHRKLRGHHATQRRRTIEVVDTAGTAHFLTTEAAADGYRGGRYVAVCGADVLPAALVAREARYCRLCAPIPTQRARGSRTHG